MRLWRRKTHTETPELDRQLAADEQARADVAKMRAESDRLSQRLDHHARHNHFSERIIAGILSTERGRPA